VFVPRSAGFYQHLRKSLRFSYTICYRRTYSENEKIGSESPSPEYLPAILLGINKSFIVFASISVFQRVDATHLKT